MQCPNHPAVVFVLSLLFAGCLQQCSCPPCPQINQTPPQTQPKICTYDTDCLNSEKCKNGTCVPRLGPDFVPLAPCNTSAQCPGGQCTDGVCTPLGGNQTPGRHCVTKADCYPGEVCVRGYCET